MSSSLPNLEALNIQEHTPLNIQQQPTNDEVLNGTIHNLTHLVSQMVANEHAHQTIKDAFVGIQGYAGTIRECWERKVSEKQEDFDQLMFSVPPPTLNVMQNDVKTNKQRMNNDPFTIDPASNVIKNTKWGLKGGIDLAETTGRIK
jgi:hypothetical protein